MEGEEFPSLPHEIPDLKNKAGDKKAGMKQTIYNMAYWDILTIHEIRLKVHNFYFDSFSDPVALQKCYEALMQMFIIFEHGISPRLRHVITDRFREFRNDFLPYLIAYRMNRVPISGKTYDEARKAIMKLEREVYKAKHKVGLHIPTEFIKDGNETLDERMGVSSIRKHQSKEKKRKERAESRPARPYKR